MCCKARTDSPQELKTIEDWLLARAYRVDTGGGRRLKFWRHDDAVPSAARSEQAAYLRYLRRAGAAAAQREQRQRRGGFYSQGGQIYYIRGLGLVRNTADIGNIVLAMHNGIPVYVHDVAKVQIGHAVRLGQFGYMRQQKPWKASS